MCKADALVDNRDGNLHVEDNEELVTQVLPKEDLPY